MPIDARTPVVALRRSHDRLAGLAADLGAEGPEQQSYCDEWSVAQVFSHLGSGAEIGRLWLADAVAHRDPAGNDPQPIWDRWNALPPEQQVSEALAMDDAYITDYERLSDDELRAASLNLFGAFDVDGSGLASMRLSEHLFHTWDVDVMLHPEATMPSAGASLLFDDNLPRFVDYFGKAEMEPFSLTVRTTEPERSFVLTKAEGVSIDPADGRATDGELRLPTEAFLRLVYGRLDDDHLAGAVLDSDTVTRPRLRELFSGA